MRRIPALILLVAAMVAHAAPPGALVPGADIGAWRPLLAALASKGDVMAGFTERRYFPFRREPTVLKGVIRVSPSRGLSLQYLEPEPSTLIADASGLEMKDARGGVRQLPSGSRESGAVSSLLPIMRFDLEGLYARFDIAAVHLDGGGWRFDFSPKDAAVSRALGTISVSGTGTDVRHLSFVKSASQRVEIEVGESRTGSVFTESDLRQFFR